ncbi:hypothetical protein T552_02307 [Pneumocystis carinii B80]|uniref:Xaa-Pro aminopeptidase P n=1 Tax=Pneumocystis carinii (strain B80) TaxID=1408658 RepID=A0A0W4ZG17_PNEC8|nr:hypothetical protein T552_02307 [Pneumocystis carinii B80]KTW27323.1 hypothetical protein T552_02307 [Pneumocystis carinii B80]
MTSGIVPVGTGENLNRLRSLMNENNVDIYIVPSGDAHSSEYIAECDARRAFISGFDGSAGCAVITQKEACLFTDGRYFLQASQQLDKNWTLMKLEANNPTWQDWTVQQAKEGKTAGVDPTLISFYETISLSKRLALESNGKLVNLPKNLVDEVWSSDRPKRPNYPVTVHPFEFSGEESSEKVSKIREFLKKKNAYAFFISMLDDIAWLFNLRGTDIPYNPVFFAYSLVTHDKIVLYIDDSKLDDHVREHLKCVEIKPYDSVFKELATLKDEIDGKKVVISDAASWAVAIALGETNIEITRSPISEAKTIKNEKEIEGMRNCHVRDGVALVKFFAWLEEFLKNGGVLDEVDAADQLESYRKEQAHFVGLSFPTISSSGKNGAIIHYKPEKESCSPIDINHIYLCDSGAQYRDGTTDVTRTYHFGVPTEKERKTFTCVLKGHIALAMAVFPRGTTGYILDILARQYLWGIGLDYLHGTGHGVGSFLNVHEPPIGIAQKQLYNEMILLPGMVLSDEPGFYENGCYGQRIESIVAVKNTDTTYHFGNSPYYGFEYLTMCPLGLNLIDLNLLQENEKQWINSYHKLVLEKLGPFLEDDLRAYKWLIKETQFI